MSEILVLKLGGTTLADQRAGPRRGGRGRPARGRSSSSTAAASGSPSGSSGSASRAASRAACGSPTPAALEVAAAVLRGVVNSELVAGLRDLGVDAVGPVGRGRRPAHRRARARARASWPTSSGVRRDLLDALLVAGQVPVVAPLARDEQGIVCNVNADDAAAGIAAGLGARQLVLLTDVDGVRDARRPTSSTRIDRRRGRGAHRRRRRSPAAWCPRSGPPSARSAGTAPRRSSPTRRRPDALRPRPRRPDLRDARDRGRGRGRCGRDDGRAATVDAPARADRQRAIRELVARVPIGSQDELVEQLARARLRGHPGHRQPRRRRARPGQGRRAATATSTSRRRTSRRRRRAAVRRAPAPDPRRHPGPRRPERPDPAS